MIPPDDLSTILSSRGVGYTIVTADNCDSLRPTNDWGIGLTAKEIAVFSQTFPVASMNWIDLRAFLRKAGQGSILIRLCRHLAERAYGRYCETNDSAALQAAYALTAEAWLAEEDVTNLIAYIPADKFLAFFEEGKALRVYRSHTYRSPNSRCTTPIYSLPDLTQRGLPEGYREHPWSFRILENYLAELTGVPILDLGQLLWQAGQSRELIRTLWLFSQDALAEVARITSSAWLPVKPTYGGISEMAMRAVLLHGLCDPWLWDSVAGYRDSLAGCYRHLDRCLLTESQLASGEGAKAFAHILQAWCSCYLARKIRSALENTLEASRGILQDNPSDQRSDAYCEAATRLRDVGEQLLDNRRIDLADEGVAAEPRSAAGLYMTEMATSGSAILSPSPLFRQFYGCYLTLNQAWRKFREQMSVQEQASGEVLAALVTEYQRLAAYTHVPAHELAVLEWAYRQDVEGIQRRLQAIGDAAFLRVNLRSPWVTLDTTERVHFEVQNIGSRTAYQVRLELETDGNAFSMHSESTFAVADLPQGDRRQFTWQVTPKSGEMTLHIRCSYRDHERRIVDHPLEPISIPVHSRIGRGGKPAFDPYPTIRLPASGELFYGRRVIVGHIIKRLVKSSVTMISGPRRIGKTSILAEIYLMLTDLTERRRMELELGLDPAVVVALNKIRPVNFDLQGLSRYDPRPNEVFFSRLYQRICDELKLGYNTDEVVQAFKHDPLETFRRRIADIFRQFPEQEIQLLILMDEWDELYCKEFDSLHSNIRSLMQTQKRINWIFTSTWGAMREIVRPSSALYNLFERVDIEGVDETDAIRLITEPSRKVNVEWQGEAIINVINETAGWPFLIVSVCGKVFDLLSKGTNEVTVELVRTAIHLLQEEITTEGLYFGYLWQADNTAKDEKFEPMRWLGRLVLWCLTECHPAAQSFEGIEDWIKCKLGEHGLTVPGSESNLSEALEEEIKRLDKIYGAIKQVKRSSSLGEQIKETNISNGGGGENRQEVPFYTISVPIIRESLLTLIPRGASKEKAWMARAYSLLRQELQQCDQQRQVTDMRIKESVLVK